MDHSGKPPRRTIVRLLVFFFGGIALGALSKARRPESARPAAAIAPPPPPTPERPAVPQKRSFGLRLGLAGAFVALFVAGGALTAWAGDQTAQLVDAQPSASADAMAAVDGFDTTTDAAPADPAPVDPAPADPAQADPAPADPAPADPAPVDPASAAAEAPAPAPAPQAAPASNDPAAAPAADATVVDGQANGQASPEPVAPTQAASAAPAQAAPVAPTRAAPARAASTAASQRHAQVHARIVRVVRKAQALPDPETTIPGTASLVWLNRALPDPTPPSLRLERPFARVLYRAAGADWPLVLGVLRAEGADGRVPADAATVRTLAARFAELKGQGRDDWQAAAAVTGDSSLADRAVALAHYDRAVGFETLIDGLDASKARLVRRVLADSRVSIYPAGRDDLASSRVNVRVVAVIAYLADSFGSVEVSSLVSGHRLYARPRVISAHVYGEAVDVAALGGIPIVGHQEPGGLTEQAVRALLLLPGEVEPRQIISLLGLGGPSFPLADHYDHIHVGF